VQQIAREINFSETTFITSRQPRDGGYDRAHLHTKARWNSPDTDIGHRRTLIRTSCA